MSTISLIATAAFGLEAVVAREVEALGYGPCQISDGRVEFSADLAAICRCNLWLRVADRVLVLIGRFDADNFDALFDGAGALPWEDWIPPDGAVVVNGRSYKSELTSVPACQRSVKRAIVDRLKAAHGVEILPESGPSFPVEVALNRDVAILTLDTSGPGLHKRGYREQGGVAPIKETLAAAMVLLSVWTPERPLVDPFCGTGTILIEAALIGRQLAPGRNREFVSEAWPAIPSDLWQSARQEAAEKAQAELPTRLIGSDNDARVLKLARENADRAGVGDAIHFQQQDFRELQSSRYYGVTITNPPYGERLSDRDEVEGYYRDFPEVLRRLPTWSHYVITSSERFEELVGQPATRRRKLYNGRIQCTYFQFLGPRPGERPVSDPLIQPAFGGVDEKARQLAEQFANRLAKSQRQLKKWAQRIQVEAYRIYERDIPEVPLVVDRYGEALHIAEYQRPHDQSPAEHADWLDLMVAHAAQALGVAPERAFLKRRGRQRGLSQYERVASDQERQTVREGGLQFWVNLSDYIDTGLFLDHRNTRRLVRDLAQGKRVLNLFGYTGSFSVYAAAGGAGATTTVDLSSTYLDWARDNFALNNLEASLSDRFDRRTTHRLINDDAMAFLEHHPPGPHYDLAIVDPPTFSNSKRTETVFDVQREQIALLKATFALLNPGGEVIFSTNFRRFKLEQAALEAGGIIVTEITEQTLPEEFRNRRIHRCWRLRRSQAPTLQA